MNSSTTISDTAGSPRRFVVLILGIALGLLLVLGALNYWVDPYNRFGNNRLGVFISAEREAKPVMLLRYPHDALIVGNSKAAMIPASQANGFQFFNASFAGASLEEEYYFILHFARDIKLVVLEADYLQGDTPAQGDAFAPPGFSAIFEFLFSAKTVEYSVRTITEHFKGTPVSIHPDGSSDAAGWFKLFDHEDKAARQWQLNRLMSALDRVPEGAPAHFYSKIAALLKERHIPCVVFVPPMDRELLDHFKTAEHQKIFAEWKAVLQKDFAFVIDLSDGPYSGGENFFKTDPYHFKPDTGLRLMNEKVIPMAEQAVAGQKAHPP